MDLLSIKFNRSGIGGNIGGHLINHLCYADDLCLISLSSAGMQKLLDMCSSYAIEHLLKSLRSRVGVKYSTCTWYLYLSTYLSVLAVLEYLVYGNVKVLVLVLVLDQRVLGTYK